MKIHSRWHQTIQEESQNITIKKSEIKKKNNINITYNIYFLLSRTWKIQVKVKVKKKVKLKLEKNKRNLLFMDIIQRSKRVNLCKFFFF